jgi:hypothetical protein
VCVNVLPTTITIQVVHVRAEAYASSPDESPQLKPVDLSQMDEKQANKIRENALKRRHRRRVRV